MTVGRNHFRGRFGAAGNARSPRRQAVFKAAVDHDVGGVSNRCRFDLREYSRRHHCVSTAEKSGAQRRGQQKDVLLFMFHKSFQNKAEKYDKQAEAKRLFGMIAITTKSSIGVKPWRAKSRGFFVQCVLVMLLDFVHRRSICCQCAVMEELYPKTEKFKHCFELFCGDAKKV